MIRVGVGKPRVRHTSDRWGCPDDRREANGYAWVSLDRWRKIQHYQTPIGSKYTWETQQQYLDRAEAEIKRQMDEGPGRRTTIWEMDLNVYPFGKDDYVRKFVILHEVHLVHWTWADRWLRYPLTVVFCWVWNKCHSC